jgi:hypothetical protein
MSGLLFLALHLPPLFLGHHLLTHPHLFLEMILCCLPLFAPSALQLFFLIIVQLLNLNSYLLLVENLPPHPKKGEKPENLTFLLPLRYMS